MAEFKTQSIDDLLKKATDLPEDRIDYANNVRVNLSINEVTLDFFYISPNPKQPQGEPQVKHVQRVLLPLNVAKETAEILLSSMLQWEETFGVTLPLTLQGDSDRLGRDEES